MKSTGALKFLTIFLVIGLTGIEPTSLQAETKAHIVTATCKTYRITHYSKLKFYSPT